MATQNTEYWNYVDVFAYALALSGEGKFKADPEKWHTAIDELFHEYSGEWPELFEHIYFERPHGFAPYSPQVEHFLNVVAQAGKLSAPNPAYVILEMNDDQRDAIESQNKQRLADRVDLIGQMGERLKKHLAI